MSIKWWFAYLLRRWFPWLGYWLFPESEPPNDLWGDYDGPVVIGWDTAYEDDYMVRAAEAWDERAKKFGKELREAIEEDSEGVEDMGGVDEKLSGDRARDRAAEPMACTSLRCTLRLTKQGAGLCWSYGASYTCAYGCRPNATGDERGS